jgi:class 3 adenylate cyclase
MQCPRCLARNREGRRFCAECGAPLALPCSSCGFSNEPGEKYCGGCGLALTPADRPPDSTSRAPHTYTPSYLVDKILALKSALEGERKQVTVLFADLKDSTELIRGLDPEAAQRLLDPALRHMMDAVHRFEGTVNQVLGDGIMSLFGAPIAHEDHALRACYAALAMQAAMRTYTEEVRRAHGLEMRIRVGLNSGEVVVRAIGNDLHMDYSAGGETTHLAARIDRLSPEEKRLLQTAAVIGNEVPLPLLQTIAELPEEVLYRGLTHLQAAEFRYETRLFPEQGYTVRPWPWPRNSACARSRPIVISASARCIRRSGDASRPTPSCLPPSSCIGPWR